MKNNENIHYLRHKIKVQKRASNLVIALKMKKKLKKNKVKLAKAIFAMFYIPGNMFSVEMVT